MGICGGPLFASAIDNYGKLYCLGLRDHRLMKLLTASPLFFSIDAVSLVEMRCHLSHVMGRSTQCQKGYFRSSLANPKLRVTWL